MELEGYMYRIMRVVDNMSEIDKNTLNLLSLFVFNSYLSIYQISKIIESKELKPIAYKNTHKKVQRLIKLHLIERVLDSSIISERELERGAIYYKLSEEGIFSLFYDSNVLAKPSYYYYYDQTFDRKKDGTLKLLNIFLDCKKEIFKNHKDSNFFELFLHPWIDIDTVLHLDEKTLDIIRLFLADCCNVVKDHVLSFPRGTIQLSTESTDGEYFNNERELESKDEFDLSALNEGDNLVMENPSLSFLNQLFFSFESDKVKVKKTTDNDGNHIIFISSVSHYPKSIQFIYNKQEKKLDIISIDKDNLTKISSYTEDDPIKNIKLTMYKVLSSYLKKFDPSSLYHKVVFSIAMEDIKNQDRLILKDIKFKEMFLKINNKFCSS